MNANELVASQALDEGLWFVARTAPEAYLQAALRELHATIEAAQVEPEPFGCVVNGTFYSLSQIRWLERHDEKYDKRTLVYTTPQPTVQAEPASAEPLTDDQITDLAIKHGLHRCGHKEREAIHPFACAIEALHGIKEPS